MDMDEYRLKQTKTMFVTVGIPGCGKSTWAKRNFNPNEIVGLDACRETLAGRLVFPREINAPAAKLLEAHVEALVALGETIVLDCTNLTLKNRERYVTKAQSGGYRIVFVNFTDSVDLELCRSRVAQRAADGGADIPDYVMEKMHRDYLGWRETLRAREYDEIILPSSVDRIIPLIKANSFAFIGDLHGQFEELATFLSQWGVVFDDEGYCLELGPEAPMLVFVGDLVDRGPQNAEVVRCVKSLVEGERAVCVQGNHDEAVGRMLTGQRRKGMSQQSVKTVEEMEHLEDAVELGQFLLDLPLVVAVSSHTTGERYIVSHAGVPLTGEAQYGFLAPCKWERAAILKGWKTGAFDEHGRMEVTPVNELRTGNHDFIQVHGHLNQSEKQTGTFIVPYVHDGVVCVESRIEHGRGIGVFYV